MIFDKTGSLLNTKRHDYLPFGEELFAGQGGRTLQQGYTADSVRQKFTQKERDPETGLDYFLARYYSSAQGRFTGTDPLQASGRAPNPQSWNRYAYVLNNPLHFVDPDGLREQSNPATTEPQQPVPPPVQQPTPARTPQAQQTLAPKIPLTNITFGMTPNPGPSALVPLGTDANNVMNQATTLMANNDLNAMMAISEIELHPETAQSAGVALTLNISEKSSIEISATKTVFVRSRDAALLETGLVNRTIQGGTAQALESMVSPIPGTGDCPPRIGEIATPSGGNMAAALADFARDTAQGIGQAHYQRFYSANSSEPVPR
jgi:RHS repeat-associated protein